MEQSAGKCVSALNLFPMAGCMEAGGDQNTKVAIGDSAYCECRVSGLL